MRSVTRGKYQYLTKIVEVSHWLVIDSEIIDVFSTRRHGVQALKLLALSIGGHVGHCPCFAHARQHQWCVDL